MELYVKNTYIEVKGGKNNGNYDSMRCQRAEQGNEASL